MVTAIRTNGSEDRYAPALPIAPLRPISALRLSAFQRILLATDGTVTDILEMYSGESMRVIKLDQELVPLDEPIDAMELKVNDRVLTRKILLQGKISLFHFLYAESIIVPDRLEERVRDGLLHSNKPIGTLIVEDRLETFREIVDCGTEAAGPLAHHFGVEETAMMICRTYRIFAGRRPIMLITEKFPESHFAD